jgi:hypothetical protein
VFAEKERAKDKPLTKYINTLVEEVETIYSARMSEAGLQVLVSRVGMACVAQRSTDKKHYRA